MPTRRALCHLRVRGSALQEREEMRIAAILVCIVLLVACAPAFPQQVVVQEPEVPIEEIPVEETPEPIVEGPEAEEEEPIEETPVVEEPKNPQILIDELGFLPNNITIPRGETLEFINNDLTQQGHSLIGWNRKNTKDRFSSAAVRSGANWSYTFETKGTYEVIDVSIEDEQLREDFNLIIRVI